MKERDKLVSKSWREFQPIVTKVVDVEVAVDCIQRNGHQPNPRLLFLASEHLPFRWNYHGTTRTNLHDIEHKCWTFLSPPLTKRFYLIGRCETAKRLQTRQKNKLCKFSAQPNITKYVLITHFAALHHVSCVLHAPNDCLWFSNSFLVSTWGYRRLWAWAYSCSGKWARKVPASTVFLVMAPAVPLFVLAWFAASTCRTCFSSHVLYTPYPLRRSSLGNQRLAWSFWFDCHC